MSVTQTKQYNTATSHSAAKKPYVPEFNYDVHIKELNERFVRLVKQLGPNNKAGTTRHEFEVEFAYAIHELKVCPIYMQGKRFEHATALIGNLQKTLQDEKEA
jgi:hypothetical protein